MPAHGEHRDAEAESAIEGRDDKHEKAMFAVFQVLKKLRAGHQAAWYGEKAVTP